MGLIQALACMQVGLTCSADSPILHLGMSALWGLVGCPHLCISHCAHLDLKNVQLTSVAGAAWACLLRACAADGLLLVQSFAHRSSAPCVTSKVLVRHQSFKPPSHACQPAASRCPNAWLAAGHFVYPLAQSSNFEAGEIGRTDLQRVHEDYQAFAWETEMTAYNSGNYHSVRCPVRRRA